MSNTSTNAIAVGTVGCVKGKLSFSAYLTRICEGENLQKYVQQQKERHVKFPITDPCIRFTLENPSVVCKDPQNPTTMDKYLHEQIYQRKEDQVSIMSIEKKAKNVPRLGHRLADGSIDDITESLKGRMLANDQDVYVYFECFGTDKGNNGVSVQSVVFPDQPKFYDPLSKLAGGTWNAVPKEPLQNVPDAVSDAEVSEETAATTAAPEPEASEMENDFAPESDFVPAGEDDNPWA